MIDLWICNKCWLLQVTTHPLCWRKTKYFVDCSVGMSIFCPAVVICPRWTSIIGFVIVICRLCSLVSNLVVVFHIKEVNVSSRCGGHLQLGYCTFLYTMSRKKKFTCVACYNLTCMSRLDILGRNIRSK